MENDFYRNLITNICKIMRDRNLTQAAIAEFLGITSSQFSKVLKYEVKISFLQLSKLATNLSMSEIDILTYPDKYVKLEQVEAETDTLITTYLLYTKSRKLKSKRGTRNQILADRTMI